MDLPGNKGHIRLVVIPQGSEWNGPPGLGVLRDIEGAQSGQHQPGK